MPDGDIIHGAEGDIGRVAGGDGGHDLGPHFSAADLLVLEGDVGMIIGLVVVGAEAFPDLCVGRAEVVPHDDCFLHWCGGCFLIAAFLGGRLRGRRASCQRGHRKTAEAYGHPAHKGTPAEQWRT